MGPAAPATIDEATSIAYAGNLTFLRLDNGGGVYNGFPQPPNGFTLDGVSRVGVNFIQNSSGQLQAQGWPIKLVFRDDDWDSKQRDLFWEANSAAPPFEKPTIIRLQIRIAALPQPGAAGIRLDLVGCAVTESVRPFGANPGWITCTPQDVQYGHLQPSINAPEVPAPFLASTSTFDTELTSFDYSATQVRLRGPMTVDDNWSHLNQRPNFMGGNVLVSTQSATPQSVLFASTTVSRVVYISPLSVLADPVSGAPYVPIWFDISYTAGVPPTWQ